MKPDVKTFQLPLVTFRNGGDRGSLRGVLSLTVSTPGSPQKRVANLWTEFTAHRSNALIQNGKEPENPSKLVMATTFEMAKT